MEIGGNRQFRFPRALHFFVQGYDSLQDGPVRIEQDRLVGRGEISPLIDQFPESGIVAPGDLAAPGEEKPDLEVKQVLVPEVPDSFGNGRPAVPAR